MGIFDAVGPAIGSVCGESASYYDPSDLLTAVPASLRSFVEGRPSETVQSDGSGELQSATAVIASTIAVAPVRLGRLVRGSITWTVISIRTLPGGDYECGLRATAGVAHGQPERRIRRP